MELTEKQKEIAIKVMRDLGYTCGWDEGIQLIECFLSALPEPVPCGWDVRADNGSHLCTCYDKLTADFWKVNRKTVTPFYFANDVVRRVSDSDNEAMQCSALELAALVADQHIDDDLARMKNGN